jgi:hypothetical protein
MGAWHSTSRPVRLAGLVLLLAAALCGAAFKGSDRSYLPLCGPTPLRFEKPFTNTVAVVTPSIEPENGRKTPLSATNVSKTPASDAVQTAPAPEPPLPASTNAPGTAALDAIKGAPSPSTDSSGPANSAGSPLSASELLVVTPQMLADFLKPASGSTPATGFTNTASSAAEALPFMPPSPKTSPGSQATYRVQ